MKHSYLYIYLFTLALIGTLFGSPQGSLAQTSNGAIDSAKTHSQKAAIRDTRNNRPQDLNIAFKPFTPFTLGYKNEADSKVLSNVKVFPNPVSDQINLAFNLNKDSKVTIKVMDALGNDVMTLLSQQLAAGDQNHGFPLTSKLNTGYYFIRVMAGTETIVKRIQIL